MIERTGSVVVIPRTARIWAVTAAVVAALGIPAGPLWAAIAPAARYVVVRGQPFLVDPESQALIGTDGRYALIAVTAGVLCGIAAYLAGGRDNDVALLLGLAAGGVIAALLAWWIGHQMGMGGYNTALDEAADGTVVKGVPDLRAKGVLLFWPLASVVTYGLLEMFVARLAPRDRGDEGAGEADQVGGGQLDLESAPTGGDIDGREPR